MKLRLLKVALLASVFVLQGCGGSDDSSPKTGVFLDSPVRFIDYMTKNSDGEITRDDQTNADGEYEYTQGETVTFSIGKLEFPPVMASGVVTPLDIAETENPNNAKAVKILRLLQTLDIDGNPDNGITITPKAKEVASSLVVDPSVNVFDLPEAQFVATVDSVIKDGGQEAPVTELVSTVDAVSHFESSLTGSNISFDPVDAIAPVITLNIGDNPATVTQNTNYTDPGAKALDDVDGFVTVTTTGTVDIATVGTYILTYNALDAAGNVADEVTRTVNVVAPPAVDSTPPVITLKGASTVTLTQGQRFTDPGADATDTVDGEVEVIVTGTVNTAAVGSYTLTYTAKDAVGNNAIAVTRTVNVIAPNKLPTAEAGDDQSGVEGFSVTLTGSGADEDGTIASYRWTEAGVEKGTTATLVLANLALGNYTFTLTVTDDKGGQASDTVDVTIGSIHGSWSLYEEGGVTLHLLPDGRFLATQWSEDSAETEQGFEYGTYTASKTALTFTTRENHDGDVLTCGEDKGTNCTGEDGTVKGVWGYALEGNKLTIAPPDEPSTFTFDKIPSSSEFEGLWESLEGKELILFTGSEYYYIDYQSEGADDNIVFEIGSLSATGNTDGVNNEVSLTSNITFSRQGRVFDCTDCGGSIYYDVVNKQLVLILPEDGDDGETSRVYLNKLFERDAPANTGTLVAQKQYASDVLANEKHSLRQEDDYRTSIETPNFGAPIDVAGNSFSVVFNVDEASAAVKSTDGSTRLETRLNVSYRVPDTNDGVTVSLRFRSLDGNPAGKYVISRCINNDCDNEVYLEGSLSGFAGDFTGDHTMSIDWDNTNQAFVFKIDEKTASISISDYTQNALVVNSGGHAFNTDQYIGFKLSAEALDVQNVGENAYLSIHLDEVKLNGGIYDNFTNGLIDDRRWTYRAEER